MGTEGWGLRRWETGGCATLGCDVATFRSLSVSLDERGREKRSWRGGLGWGNRRAGFGGCVYKVTSGFEVR